MSHIKYRGHFDPYFISRSFWVIFNFKVILRHILFRGHFEPYLLWSHVRSFWFKFSEVSLVNHLTLYSGSNRKAESKRSFNQKMPILSSWYNEENLSHYLFQISNEFRNLYFFGTFFFYFSWVIISWFLFSNVFSVILYLLIKWLRVIATWLNTLCIERIIAS